MRIKLLRHIFPAAAVFALVVSASAAPPKKPSVGQFSQMISASPFTIKPPPAPPTQVGTPLERDWMLGSIRPGKDGYSVTLINKKDRKNRIRFIPGFSSADFQLLEVKQDPNNSSNSRVKVKKGSLTAWLTYDEKLIKVRPTATAAKKVSSSSRSGSSRSTQRGGPPIPGKSGTSSQSSRQRTLPKRR